MNQTQARTRLTELGFSLHDAERMVATNALDRSVGGQIASGLTTNAEISVWYQPGRYQVRTRSRPPGPAPCMWPREHWTTPWKDA